MPPTTRNCAVPRHKAALQELRHGDRRGGGCPESSHARRRRRIIRRTLQTESGGQASSLPRAAVPQRLVTGSFGAPDACIRRGSWTCELAVQAALGSEVGEGHGLSCPRAGKRSTMAASRGAEWRYSRLRVATEHVVDLIGIEPEDSPAAVDWKHSGGNSTPKGFQADPCPGRGRRQGLVCPGGHGTSPLHPERTSTTGHQHVVTPAWISPGDLNDPVRLSPPGGAGIVPCGRGVAPEGQWTSVPRPRWPLLERLI